MLTVLENYLLRVERFGKLTQALLIQNSELSFTRRDGYSFEEPNL